MSIGNNVNIGNWWETNPKMWGNTGKKLDNLWTLGISLSLSLSLHRLLDLWGYTITLTLTLLWGCNGIRHNNAIWDCLKMADGLQVVGYTIGFFFLVFSLFSDGLASGWWCQYRGQLARNIPGRIPQISAVKWVCLKMVDGHLFHV